MNPITHLLASWTVADAARCSARDRAIVTWCGVLPDADGLGAVVDAANSLVGKESWHYGTYHHSLLHGFLAAIVLPLALGAFAERKLRTMRLGVVVIHLHLLCDLIGSRGPSADDIWPIHYLAPLSDAATVAWSGQWAINAWPNVAFSIGLMFWAFARAIRGGYSPVGVFSKKADRVFVETVRNRWKQVSGFVRAGRS